MHTTTVLGGEGITCYLSEEELATCLWGAGGPLYASPVHADEAVQALDTNPYA